MVRGNQQNRRKQRPAGVSLAEVILCSMLIGVMVVASMRAVTATRLTHWRAAELSAGPGLAQELLSEVLAQAYADPQAPDQHFADDAEPSREFYDDVDDYDGYSAAAETRRRSTIDGYAGWTLSVEVERVNDDMTASSVDTGLKRVTVTATHPRDPSNPDDDDVTVLAGLRGATGQFGPPPPADVDAVTWIGVALQANGAPAASRTGVQLPNLAEDPN